MTDKTAYFNRILQTALAFVPVCMGLFAFLNNVTDWNGTMERVTFPLLSMEGNTASDTQGWRAAGSPALAHLTYGFVIALELLMGLLAAFGAVGMIRHRKGSLADFRRSGHWVGLACLLGAFIYCFIFFTIGGDWFLAWKNENLLFLQSDSLNYAAVLAIVFLYLRFSLDEIP
ncbi:MAG: DUF2165 family protein [Gammaproteobacteria bacterium]|nr:DUF2165 family protein [Gammaproteobacteria bacterium]